MSSCLILLVRPAKSNSSLSVPLIAAETFGANCLVESLRSSYSTTPPVPRQATIPRINSIATSLGARTPSRQAVEACVRHPGGVISLVMSDKRAVETLVGFAGGSSCCATPETGTNEA